MGACGSSLTPEERMALDASRKIDTRNKSDYNTGTDAIKMLLLGAGESGKSTIFKQMKIIHASGFSYEEIVTFRRYVWGNILEAIKAICEAVDQTQELPALQAKDSFDILMATQVNADLTPELGRHVGNLWADPVIQTAWDRRSAFQVIETTKVYMSRLAEIAQPGYMPTMNDILHSRVRTTGIVEERYVIDSHTFVLFDVGGQRNERKKWIHCFDGVNAVIFVAALSEYDQKLFEDESTCRMVEALNLFEEICNSRWFTKTSIMLFLNKCDLFEEKIQRVLISDTPEFADCTVALGDRDGGLKYFLEKFLSLNKKRGRDIYTHITCATNTENIAFVFNACKEIILKQNLEENGFVN